MPTTNDEYKQILVSVEGKNQVTYDVSDDESNDHNWGYKAISVPPHVSG